MSYDFQSILRAALQGGLGQSDFTDPTGQRTKDSYTDPTTGLTVLKDGNGYRFVQPGQGGMNTAWDMSADGTVGDARQYKTAGLGSMVGEFAKEGALPLALAALGANMFGPALNGGSVNWNPFASLADGGGGELLGEGLGGGATDAAAGSATKAALYGAEGYGAGMTGAATGLYDAGLAATGGGLLSGLGSLKDIVKIGGALAGGLAGSQGTQGGQQTTQRTLDPRIDAMVFGQGGLLSDAQNWYNQNKSGQNDTMKLASSQLTGLLSDPNLKNAIYTQGAAGTRMMNQPIASNPFTRQGFNGTNWWGS